MAARIAWDAGGEADFVLLDDDRAELLSSVPFAPGSRPEGHLAEPPNSPVWIKVHRSKREDDGRYHVSGRVINITRELRAHLQSMSTIPPPPWYKGPESVPSEGPHGCGAPGAPDPASAPPKEKE